MARDALTRAKIPFFPRQENLTGLSGIFPATPTPGVGVTWSILVPEAVVEKAKEALVGLPLDLEKEPDFYDFHPELNKNIGFKIFVWTSIIIMGGFLLYALGAWLSEIFHK